MQVTHVQRRHKVYIELSLLQVEWIEWLFCGSSHKVCKCKWYIRRAELIQDALQLGEELPANCKALVQRGKNRDLVSWRWIGTNHGMLVLGIVRDFQ